MWQLEELQLPDDYDERYIPDGKELSHAAVRALHREDSFIILHQGEPQAIADRLDTIASVILAASAIKGPHQVKAIRLGLALRGDLWLSRGKLDDWVRLLAPLLVCAMEVGDEQLRSQLFRAWSIYLYLSGNPSQAHKALESALRYAADANRDDLALMMWVEHFNVDIEERDPETAEQEMWQIVREARRLSFHYVAARAFFAMARAYNRADLPRLAFSMAQQSLVYAVRLRDWSLSGECVGLMLHNVQRADGRAERYAARLLEYLSTLAPKSANPYIRAAICYGEAVRLYHQGQLELARRHVLSAWLIYRTLHDTRGAKIAEHMLGLIQYGRKRWRVAEHHLEAVRSYFLQKNDLMRVISAEHAIAYYSFCERGRWQEGLRRLQSVHRKALELGDSERVLRLVRTIEVDIATARRQLLAIERPSQPG